MAFGQQKTETADDGIRSLDPNISNDKRIILDFERELDPYTKRSLTLFPGTRNEIVLRGFSLYLHERNLFRYSERYKLGAVVSHGSEGTLPYLDAMRKYEGLCRLMDQRKYREAQEQEALATVAA
jgi:hypothetical protein